MERTDYKYRLAKSTLALIPLLGMHYIVFLAINNETVASDSVTLQVKVAFEMIFTSFQVQARRSEIRDVPKTLIDGYKTVFHGVGNLLIIS